VECQGNLVYLVLDAFFNHVSILSPSEVEGNNNLFV
jgi:hypothetical protein